MKKAGDKSHRPSIVRHQKPWQITPRNMVQGQELEHSKSALVQEHSTLVLVHSKLSLGDIGYGVSSSGGLRTACNVAWHMDRNMALARSTQALVHSKPVLVPEHSRQAQEHSSLAQGHNSSAQGHSKMTFS